MLDDAELEANVLEFSAKSFSFDRSVEIDGRELALFHRTETETESRFRPKVIRLSLIVPKDWVVLDPASDLLRLGKDGAAPEARHEAEAVEAAAQSSRFEESGIAWRRVPTPGGGFAYCPEEWAERLLSPDGLARLGLS